ncbi:MAG TPA: EF-hand domain-containing protein [Sphingomonas sp.]|nr:EF-hand domain-containing protein [Sphingomonas sp.]
MRVLALALPVAGGALGAKPPRNAPSCARPGTQPVFISPMGEPFRVAPGEPYPSAVWFSGADRNKDGELTRGELVADAARFFAQLDADRDGRLTPDEVAAYEFKIAPETALFATRPDDFYDRERRRRHEPDAMGRSSDYGGAMGAGRYAWLNIPEPVAAADQDFDRVVTATEFADAAGRAFDALKVGGAGALKLAALPRTPAQIGIEGPCRSPKDRTR